MKKELLPVVAIGIVFSAMNAFVSMYLGLKIGFSDGIAVLLLFVSFIIISALGIKTRSKSLLYISAILMGSTGVAVSYTDGLGAIIMSGKPFGIPDYAMTGILVLSGILGILISYYFAGYFLKSDFPWPGSRVTASLVNMLTAEKKEVSQKVSVIRMGTSAAISGGIAGLRSLGAFPTVFGSVNFGLSASPMMAGIGMLMGWRACIQIAAGALGSLLVFIFIEGSGSEYSAHMRNPWIFSTAISMMVATAVITMYIVMKPALASFMKQRAQNKILASDGGTRNIRLPLMNYRQVALIVAIVCAAILMAVFPGVPAWVFLLSLPIAVLFMVIETRGKSEMGMSVGMSSFVILLIVGLAFDNIIPLLVLEGFVVATILTFALMLSVQKQAEFCGVEARGLTLMALIGVITGAVICVPFMKFFNSLYVIGSAALPAPYSVMWLEMANSAVAKVVSPSINPFLLLAGIVIALVLYRYRISAVIVAIGLLLPVSTSATIIVGGIIAYVIEKKGYLKNDNGITASGLMTGDIVVSILASLRYL